MAARILLTIILFLSVVYLPFWVSVLLALGGMIYFPKYWEAVGLFLLSDTLFGANVEKFGGVVFVSFLASLFVLIIAEILKKKLKFYKTDGLANF